MKTTQQKDSIIIVSGGLDSITLLYEYQERIALAVSFDYGSNHNSREIPFAQYHCQKLGIKHIVIPLSFMKDYFKSSLLDGDQAIPEGHYQEVNIHSTVVPFRNGIMLAIAAGLAETHHLDYVMMANHGGDHAIYPDCTPEFVNAMTEAIHAGTVNGAKLWAPYTNISKAEIAAHGKRMGIDYSKTWSCYRGGEKQCGRCATCLERKEALAAAGITDTTEYE